MPYWALDIPPHKYSLKIIDETYHLELSDEFLEYGLALTRVSFARRLTAKSCLLLCGESFSLMPYRAPNIPLSNFTGKIIMENLKMLCKLHPRCVLLSTVLRKQHIRGIILEYLDELSDEYLGHKVLNINLIVHRNILK